MTRIAIITGSTRPGRKSLTVAHWVHEAATRRTDAEFNIVDIAEHDLPHLDEPVAAAMSTDYRHPRTRRWSTTIAAYDGFVVVTPEYNHSMPGVLKNALDHLYTEWHDKSAGFVGYGTHGGTRAVEQLRLVMAELQVADVRAQVALSLFTDFDGAELTPGLHQASALDTTLDQVVRWAGRTRAAPSHPRPVNQPAAYRPRAPATPTGRSATGTGSSYGRSRVGNRSRPYDTSRSV